MNPNELRRQKAEKLAEAKSIGKQLDNAKLNLSEEQRAEMESQHEALIAEAEGLEQKAKAIEEREARARERGRRMQALEQAPEASGHFQPDAEQNVDPERPRDTRVEVSAPNFTRDPRKGFASHREFLRLVMAAGLGEEEARSDERMRFLSTVGSDEQQGSSNPYGGFLIPEGFSPNMLSVAAEGNPLLGRVTVLPMQTPVLKIPYRVDKTHTSSVSGGLTVGRRAETVAATASRMTFAQAKLEAHSLHGLAYATEELLRDSPQSFIAMLDAGFRDEFAKQQALDWLWGSGVGEPLGIMHSGALISATKDSNQTADTVTYTNIFAIRSRVWNYGRAIWLYNHDVLPQLLALKDSVGNLAWLTSLREGQPDTLLGRPAYASEYCATVGDAGDIMCVVPSEYLAGIYQPLESAESIHIRFNYFERAFRLWVRDAGIPWWETYLTPAKSAVTLSPYVTVEAR